MRPYIHMYVLFYSFYVIEGKSRHTVQCRLVELTMCQSDKLTCQRTFWEGYTARLLEGNNIIATVGNLQAYAFF